MSPIFAPPTSPEALRWTLDAASGACLRSMWPQIGPLVEDIMLAALRTAENQAAVQDLRAAERARWDTILNSGATQNYGAQNYGAQTLRVAILRQTLGIPTLQRGRDNLVLLEQALLELQRQHPRRPDRAMEELGVLLRTLTQEADHLAQAAELAEEESGAALELRDFADDFERELNEAVDYVRHNAATMEGAADEVLGASNKVRTEGDHVTQASEVTSMNARLIALAAEQLTLSFSDIMQQVANATQTATTASARSQTAREFAVTLSDMSDRIGAVVKLIERIAKETRLLALNATIEAARAGDAGRGFAVVATEVKTLADQTNTATGNIRAQIEGMQGSIRQTVEAIGDVAGQVEAVSSVIVTISEAVTMQDITTRDIAFNANEMAESMESVHARISGVAQAAERATHQASELWENANGLVRQIYGIKRRVTATLRGTHFANRRHDERIAVDVPCVCEVDKLVFKDSRLDNIGLHGAQIREKQLASADGYPIRLDVQGIGCITGTIVSTTDRDIVHVHFDTLPDNINARLVQAVEQWRQQDRALVERVQQAARTIGQLFETALARQEITQVDLFDPTYTPIPATSPQQFMAKFTKLCDHLLPDIQEPLLKADPRVVFAAAVDRNGYLPTHNRQYSEPQRPGDPEWNAAHCRNRRVFDDSTGLTAARNRMPYLVQTYRRDMGGGQTVSMRDISAPILVQNKHWGGFRMGCRA